VNKEPDNTASEPKEEALEAEPVQPGSLWRFHVQQAADLLKNAGVGGVVTYASFSQATGIEDRDLLQSIIHAARKRVRREPGYVFRAVENVGYQRLSDAEIAEHVGEESRHRLRNMTRKTAEELECVKDFASLTPEQRTKWNASYAVNGLLAHLLTAKQVKSISAGVSSVEQQKLATESLLESLKKR